VKDPESLEEELRRIPTPMPPPGLLSRVRRLGHLELARRSEERQNRLMLIFLLCFSWTVGLFPLIAVRLVGGPAPEWTGAYFLSTWIAGTAVLIVLGVHVRRERRLA